MFEKSRAFSIGEMYRQEIHHLSQNPTLLNQQESIALLTQFDMIVRTGSGIFQPRELTDYASALARLLGKEDPEAMVDSESPARFVAATRTRRHRDFVSFLDSQTKLAHDILARRTEIAYRSREWEIWLKQGWKHVRMSAIFARLRVQALIYRMGFTVDPSSNLVALADLFCRSEARGMTKIAG